ncbi:MAG: hypothetical protein VX899_27595 [Myxococcota bacterium]|nr:hypothetical protein [Myxococcota bacterium]
MAVVPPGPAPGPRFCGQLRARIAQVLQDHADEHLQLQGRGQRLRAVPGSRRQILSLRAWQLHVQTTLLSLARDHLEGAEIPTDLGEARALVDQAVDVAVLQASKSLSRRLEDQQPGHRLMRERLVSDAATLLSELCDRLPLDDAPLAAERRILDAATWERSWSRIDPSKGQQVGEVDLERVAALGPRLRILHPTEPSLSCVLAGEALLEHADDVIWGARLPGCTLVGDRFWLRLDDGSRGWSRVFGVPVVAVVVEDEVPTE